MTSIKASCPTCGEVEMTENDIILMVSNTTGRSYYEFDCDKCDLQIRKPADNEVISLLVRGGVTATVLDLPAEFLETKTGLRISYDDILDFALKLGEDYLADLAMPNAA